MKFNNMLKEIVVGILPVLVVITLLHFTITPLETELYISFLWSTGFVIIGLFLFLTLSIETDGVTLLEKIFKEAGNG